MCRPVSHRSLIFAKEERYEPFAHVRDTATATEAKPTPDDGVRK